MEIAVNSSKNLSNSIFRRVRLKPRFPIIRPKSSANSKNKKSEKVAQILKDEKQKEQELIKNAKNGKVPPIWKMNNYQRAQRPFYPATFVTNVEKESIAETREPVIPPQKDSFGKILISNFLLKFSLSILKFGRKFRFLINN